MPQKYKVFLDNYWILFTDSRSFSNEKAQEIPLNDHSEIADLNALLALLTQKGTLVIYSQTPLETMRSFFKHFKFVRTAGALVKQTDTDAYLWMQRFGHLDLPKGKIEKGESELQAAFREVEEETGITGELNFERLLGQTYHVYEMKGKSYLKENHWFALNYNGDTTLSPQTEEGIDSVFWLDESTWKARLEECYEGLKELLQSTC
jgi:8-oxo-dGTP pyrophosphatase MutT (NUDIX family)